MELVVFRELGNCTIKSTPGKMYIDGEYFSYTLEDALRHPKLKIPGDTCIPCCTLDVSVTHSTRFKRDMTMFYNQANGYEAIIEEYSWKGLRGHGGNNVSHTLGCTLVAKNRLNNDTIQGTMEKALTELVNDALICGEPVRITWVLI